MIRIGSSARLFGSISFRSSTGQLGSRRCFFSKPSETLLLHTDGNVREVLYTGPMNSLMSRIKLASVLSAGGASISTPLALYYFGSDSWSMPLSLFAVAMGKLPLAIAP